MHFEDDVKIADFGKKIEKKNKPTPTPDDYEKELKSGNIEKAALIGEKLADTLIENINKFVSDDGEDNSEMMLQRGTLLAFAATVGMEEHIKSSVILDAAKSSFNSTIEAKRKDLYRHFLESGAFSFYYLAYRRQPDEIERRIGQTFAMLCAHDGDSVYQELGEAIYCWFISLTKKIIEKI